MRTLLLLRGIPASGKSTWVREHHLEAYTLSADSYRLRLSAPVLTTDGTLEVNQRTTPRIWGMLMSDLEARMRRGDFTIIDATHCNPAQTKGYRALADKYRYSLYYLDFPVGLDEALARNRMREEYKQVPDAAIRKMYEMHKSHPMQSAFKEICDIDEIDNYFTDDLTGRFDQVRVIGDVHGCYSVMKDALWDEAGGDMCGDARTKYVFAGDMLERGLENREVMDFIITHAGRPNITFVTGNHDEFVLNWLDDTWDEDRKGRKVIPPGFLAMIGSLTDGMDEKALRKFRAQVSGAFRRFRQCYAFAFSGRRYLVTHAGISAVPKLAYIPAVQMERGVGEYEADIDGIYERSYQAGRCQGFTQVHGHRLAAELEPDTYDGTEHSVSLEGRVELGGFLKVLCIDGDGSHVGKYPNAVYDRGLRMSMSKDATVDGVTTEDATTNAIIADPCTRVKDLGNHNLISINFTARAFHKKRWNENTIKARGLFVDKDSGQIRLRSYNKFFNMDEMPFTAEPYLRAHLRYPLNVYRKQNGFLGIMSVVDGDVILASKSTNNGPFAKMFSDIFYTLSPEEIDALRTAAVANHCSFTFEACHVEDRHIIDFDTNHLWLLDAIPNSYTFDGIDIDEAFSDRVKESIPIVSGVMRKKVLLLTADSLDDVLAYEKAHAADRTIEGVVCQDRAGFMFKIKFPYYRTVKGLRSVLQAIQRDPTAVIDPRTAYDPDGLKQRFAAFFLARPYDEWRNLHIIDALALYEKANGPIM